MVSSRLRQQLAGARFIAADSGMKHARALKIVPELWVGDFDSAGSELLLDYAEVPRKSFPVEKDATDGEIAAIEAMKLGATQLILLGGLGGQADHATAHLAFALRMAQTGCSCFITNGSEEAYPIAPGNQEIKLAAGDRVSLVPWGDIGGLNIHGVKWPLDGVTVSLGSSLTLSNIATETVRISITSGIGIAFAYPAIKDELI